MIEEMTERLLGSLMMNGEKGKVVDLIVKMDRACQDWGITEKLIAHFKALEREAEKKEGALYEPIKPKKIKP